MDPTLVSTFFGGLATLIGAITLLVRAIRNSDPEQLKKVQQALHRAEQRVKVQEDRADEAETLLKDTRDKVQLANALQFKAESDLQEAVFRITHLEAVLRDHNLLDEVAP